MGFILRNFGTSKTQPKILLYTHECVRACAYLRVRADVFLIVRLLLNKIPKKFIFNFLKKVLDLYWSNVVSLNCQFD